MFTVEPLRRGRPISFADCPEFPTLKQAVSHARSLNGVRDDHPETDDGIRYDVYMDLPAGDSALVWSHRIGHTFVG